MAETDDEDTRPVMPTGTLGDDAVFLDEIARLKIEDRLANCNLPFDYLATLTQLEIVRMAMEDSQRPKAKASPPEGDVELRQLLKNITKQKVPRGFPDIDYVKDLDKREQEGMAAIIRRERSLTHGVIIGHGPGRHVFQQVKAIIAHNKASRKDSNNTTLLVTPHEELQVMKYHMDEWFPGFRTAVYYHKGKAKFQLFEDFTEFDIVLTTFGVLLIEFGRHFEVEIGLEDDMWVPSLHDLAYKRRPYLLPLYDTNSVFHRIILVEGQQIQNLRIRSLRATLALQARNRVCIIDRTTPRSATDLYAYVRFLKIAPYDHRWTYKAKIIQPLRSKSADRSDEFAELYRRLEALLVALYVEQRGESWDLEALAKLPKQRPGPKPHPDSRRSRAKRRQQLRMAAAKDVGATSDCAGKMKETEVTNGTLKLPHQLPNDDTHLNLRKVSGGWTVPPQPASTIIDDEEPTATLITTKAGDTASLLGQHTSPKRPVK